MLATNLSFAQDFKFWRVIDVGELGTPGGLVPSFDISYGVNNRGEVAGAYVLADGVAVHAFIWLPVAAYTLTAGFHDLHDLADLDTQGIDASAATAINDAGLAVGVAGDDLREQGVAWLWRVNATSGGGTPSNSLHTADGAFSVAHGINNAIPAEVVGMADFLCDADDHSPDRLGFLRTVDANSDMQELLPAGSVQSYAIDVARSDQLWIAGRDDGSGTCSVVIMTPGCHAPDMDGLLWRTGDSGPEVVLDRWMSPGGVQARSINSEGDSVGVAFAPDPQGGTNCPISAIKWNSLGSV